jgi:hypothetical protein
MPSWLDGLELKGRFGYVVTEADLGLLPHC